MSFLGEYLQSQVGTVYKVTETYSPLRGRRQPKDRKADKRARYSKAAKRPITAVSMARVLNLSIQGVRAGIKEYLASGELVQRGKDMDGKSKLYVWEAK